MPLPVSFAVLVVMISLRTSVIILFCWRSFSVSADRIREAPSWWWWVLPTPALAPTLVIEMFWAAMLGTAWVVAMSPMEEEPSFCWECMLLSSFWARIWATFWFKGRTLMSITFTPW